MDAKEIAETALSDNDDTVCMVCDSPYILADQCEPTPLCDRCAQEKLKDLAAAYLAEREERAALAARVAELEGELKTQAYDLGMKIAKLENDGDGLRTLYYLASVKLEAALAAAGKPEQNKETTDV